LFVIGCEDGFDLERLEARLERPFVGAELEPMGDFREVEVQVVNSVVEVSADGAFDVGIWEGVGQGKERAEYKEEGGDSLRIRLFDGIEGR
jgi:hypothetical protein